MEIEQSLLYPVREATERYREKVTPDWVKLLRKPPFRLSPARTARGKLGVRYERKVHARLEQSYGLEYFPSPWFAYHYRGKIRYCQPDAILALDPRRTLLIVEVKYSHTSDAYWQLENVYLPVLRTFLGASSWSLATVEICKWFDATIQFPCPVALCEDLTQARTHSFNVHILNR